jgi:epoxyqueuosine reductase QueG
MFETRQEVSKSEAREAIRSFGADLAGFVRTDHLERLMPEGTAPSTIASSMKTMVVFAKRTLRGVVRARHLQTKQLAGGRTLRALDHMGGRLASYLEALGYPSLPVASGMFDFERRLPEDITPAGQGSYLLRVAAVESGLGTWGLNMMVLTPQFGPRVYLSGVLTELELDSDPKLAAELCPGLEECGRCAAICPEDAIPRQAAIGASLDSYRGLDRAACCRSSQPYGFDAFVTHLTGVLQSLDSAGMWSRMIDARGRKTGETWSEMAIMKEGAMTGCSHCTQVCPVGADFAEMPEPVRREHFGGFVRIENVGPPLRRKTVANWNLQ